MINPANSGVFVPSGVAAVQKVLAELVDTRAPLGPCQSEELAEGEIAGMRGDQVKESRFGSSAGRTGGFNARGIKRHGNTTL